MKFVDARSFTSSYHGTMLQMRVEKRRVLSAVVLATCSLHAVAAYAGSIEGSVVEHAHHQGMPSATRRSVGSYTIPNVRLIRQDGASVILEAELNDGRPVVLTFIYTSCTSVCPLISHTLSQLQSKLGAAAARVHLVSISIDPEQDDPARLREYANSFGAGPQWQHYTGTVAASQTVQRAFDVYRGNKMDHIPATLIRLTPGAQWTRIEGFATADQLLTELTEAPALRAAR